MNYIKYCKDVLAQKKESISKKDLIEESVIIIDTNCLLYPLKDMKLGGKLIKNFNKIKDSCYIPFITQQEYINNEQITITQTASNIDKCEKTINNLKNTKNILSSSLIEKRICEQIREKIKNQDKEDGFKTFIGTIESFEEDLKNLLKEDIEKEVNTLNDKINKKLSEKSAEFEKQNKADFDKKFYIEKYSKKIVEALSRWLDDVQLGEMYTEEQIKKYESIISSRYQARVSPGFEDDGKKDKYIIMNSIPINRSYSDAIFWLDALEHIEKNINNKKYLVVLSNEKKGDWVVNEDAKDINEDMFIECHRRTRLIAKKLDVWSFMELMGVPQDSVEKSKQRYSESIDYTLYGQLYSQKSQRQMMIDIFSRVLEETSGEKYVSSLPCLQQEDEFRHNTIFDSKVVISDKKNKKFVLGLQLNRKDKLQYICKLLETRVIDSSDQLQFFDEENQNEWEDICKQVREKRDKLQKSSWLKDEMIRLTSNDFTR
ncbi:hypothetical protein BU202_06100 [Streptococcus cuniculi]|uniref:PIN like domain-containing protein n=1 Tax=Streptococcus cuniculi TaxID=1432788 RepID=A0A1Q8E722_9STRE|nr:PIN-like domain-containing protein [Streptococcus cuniculi]OLF47599.1 hypothetical protein BU202_06100 [Streptococcus cuniculi]